MRKQRTRHAGFSLVEILIAFFVLMIGILAILTLFPLGLRESKQMVDTSIASLVARNARGMMEVHPFKYDAGKEKDKLGNGTASFMHAKYGCDITQALKWVKMFPGDLLGDGDDKTFPKVRTEGSPFYREREDTEGDTHYDKVVSAEHPDYCWDARFTVGRGIGEIQSGDDTIRLMPPPGQMYQGGEWRDFTEADMQEWFRRYYRYYAVQISIYRNYTDVRLNEGEVTLKTDKREGGSYDSDDPNRPLYSELVMDDRTELLDITANWHVRLMWKDTVSDWYRIDRVYMLGGKRAFRLDRPFAPMVGAIGKDQAQISWQVGEVIATNKLVEHFTTMLGSQLDDTETGNISITSH